MSRRPSQKDEGTTAWELPLSQMVGATGPDTEHFITINAASAILILVVAGIVRVNGYFLSLDAQRFNEMLDLMPILKLASQDLSLREVSLFQKTLCSVINSNRQRAILRRRQLDVVDETLERALGRDIDPDK